MKMPIQVKKPVIAAISAAVLSYLKSQEIAPQIEAPTVKEVCQTISISQWGSSGRQAIMDMRRLLQLRMVR